MTTRLRTAAAALIMLVLFLLIILPASVLAVMMIGYWLFTGSKWIYSRVGAFGQGLDSAANVPFMDGHPKETISSHSGRYFEAKYGNKYKGRSATQPELVIPWQAHFVRWLTDKFDPDHVYKSVETWTIDEKVPL